jgi:alpha-ketoglutarate-dependent taurine dioxygenase
LPIDGAAGLIQENQTMATPAQAPSAQSRSIEEHVVQASPRQQEAAWAAAQRLPTYSDEQVRALEIQATLRDALAREVPGWTELVAAVERGLAASGIVLLRGLRFDPENRLAIGLTAAFGECSGYGNWNGNVVFDLFPIRRAPGDPDFELYFHTGSQSHPRPHELQVLLCVRQGDQGGGVSKLVHLDAALEVMRQQGNSAAIEVLRQRPFPFKRPKFLGDDIFLAPIIAPREGAPAVLEIRFQREVVFRAEAAQPGCLDAEQRAAIDALEAAMNTPGTYFEYQLQTEEYLIIDNRRVLHARTEVLGGPESGRHLKRLKAYR